MGYYLIMLIDTHAHVNFNVYKEDGKEVIKRALDENIWMINVGSEYRTSKRAVEYSEKYKEGVYAAVGLHPSHLEEQTVKDENEIEFDTKGEELDIEKYKELAENEKVVAIGEIGLDYYHLRNDVILNEAKRNEESRSSKKESTRSFADAQDDIVYRQKQVFLEQIDLARQIEKPVIIHCRNAYDDLFELLSIFTAGCASCPYSCAGAGGAPLKGVIHCFNGTIEEANKFIDMGFYLSFNGIITFANQYDDVVREVSLDKILIETDCPYLTPVPNRGKRNEPMYVKYVAEKIADLKEIKFEEVADKTTENARNLFGI